MSYFFGSAENNGFMITGRRRHNKHRSLSNDREIELIHGLKHRKKHGTGKKYILKSKPILKESLSNNLEDNVSSSNKSKRYLHKEIAKLVEENRLLSLKLEGTKLDSDNMSGSKKKNESTTKLRKKYQKLEESYYKMQAELDKINVVMTQRENEFRQLYAHHEECTMVIKNFEHERNGFTGKINKLENENSQSNEDISLLKTLVYKLNIEIEKYQDKLRTFGQISEYQTEINIIDEVENNDNKNILKSWGKINFHVLSPLLNAYQENEKEKNELIEKYKKELNDLTGRVKHIIIENEDLHSEVRNLKQEYDKYIEERKSLEKDTVMIKEENDILTKQITVQKQKMREIHAAYEKEIQLMYQENNKLHKDYTLCKTELSNMKGKCEILNEGYEKLKCNLEKTMPVSVHFAKIEECQKLFEELKQQYECEKKKLNERIHDLEETKLENEKQIKSLSTERDQLKIQTNNLEKNLKRIQSKLESVQSINHSIQKSRDSLKQQLSEATFYCGKLIKEREKLIEERKELINSLHKKEKENENIQCLGNNIVQRMGILKNQLKIIQEEAKEQLDSVGKHIKKQELGADQMKTKYERELQRLKQLLEQKEKVIQELQREKDATQNNLELVWKAATINDEKIKRCI